MNTRRIGSRIKAAFYDRDAVASFTVLRLGVACVLLSKSLRELAGLGTLYGAHGLLPWGIADHARLSIFPKLSVIARLFSRVGLDADATLSIAFTTYCFALSGMLLRPSWRLPVFVAWYLHLVFFGVSMRSVYGLDCFANIALFYCLVGPNGDLGALRVKRAGVTSYEGTLVLRLLQFNVCVVYLSAAWAKAHGPDWWDGESIWRAVSQPQFQGVLPASWFHRVPLLAKASGWATIVVEAAYPLVVWLPRLRRAGVIAIVGMHLGIAVLLNLWLFAGMMVVLNTAAFGVQEVRWIAGRIRHLFSVAAASVRHRRTLAPALRTPQQHQ